MGITYDTGALVAADRGDRCMWARHRALLTGRVVPLAPAPVVAQAWRGGSRQARLARLLRGCDVDDLDDHQARSIGELLGKAGTADIVDACVVEGALRRRDLVVSSDLEDLMTLATAVNRRLEVERP
ncbi:MAG: twitching motility protein PilT [Acidimicrobiales bacterium]